jgi:hypothetical protein
MFVGGKRPGLGLYIRFHPFHLQHPVASVGNRNRLSGLPLESAIVLSEGPIIKCQIRCTLVLVLRGCCCFWLSHKRNVKGGDALQEGRKYGGGLPRGARASHAARHSATRAIGSPAPWSALLLLRARSAVDCGEVQRGALRHERVKACAPPSAGPATRPASRSEDPRERARVRARVRARACRARRQPPAGQERAARRRGRVWWGEGGGGERRGDEEGEKMSL